MIRDNSWQEKGCIIKSIVRKCYNYFIFIVSSQFVIACFYEFLNVTYKQHLEKLTRAWRNESKVNLESQVHTLMNVSVSKIRTLLEIYR